MLKFFLILLGVSSLFFLLRWLEPSLIFFPSKEMIASPKGFNLDFEDVFFKTADDQKLHGWFVPAGRDGSPEREPSLAGDKTILFCHGNAGNISHRIDKLIFFHRLGYNVFIFDYRGYGKSEGRPSEQGLYLDVQAAYHYLKARGIPVQQIVGYGESIGGAVLIDLAAKRPMQAMILDSTFTNIKDMARIYYPWIPTWFLSMKFDSKQKIASITIPKLMIQSDADEIVPARLGADLFEAAAMPKESLRIHGSHNEGFFESEDLIEKKILDFLKEA